jgi:tetratricopeptide (TPR) repeat protein
MLDVELFGLDAGGHHAVNVAFHAANAALLFLALRALTGTLWPAAVVAALFALHPLRVESVAWVAERKDVLSGFFFMATLLAYAAYARRPGVVRYAWVFAGVALGLAAKSMLVTLPCVLLLLDVWPLRRWRRETALRLVAEKLPLLALAAAASAAAIWSQSSDGAMGDLATLPFSARLSNAVDAYAAYLGKTVWPTRLAIFYPHPALASPESYTALRVGTVAAAIGLIAATGLALQQLRGRPYLAVGWFWTLGMLVPVIGLVQVGEQAMADRYAYLSLIGVSIVIVWGVRDLATALPPLRLALVVIVPVVLVACTALTSRQVLHWRDGQSVFEHALTVTERNYFAHNHLGRTFENRGEVELAARQYEAAIAIRPSAGTLSNLGAALAKLGRHEDAVARFEDALRLEPDSASAHSNLGVVYGMFDQPQKAIAAYERALELGSQKPAPYYNLGSLLVRLGEFERGARHLEQALALDPYHAGAANNLGVAYTELGQFDAAVEVHLRVLELDPEHAGTHCNLGRSYEAAGRPSEASAFYEEALRRDPGCVHGHRFAGYQRAGEGDLDAALVHFEEVLRHAPPTAAAHNDAGSVYASKGDFERARQHFHAALRLDPGHAVARKNLEQLEADVLAQSPGS